MEKNWFYRHGDTIAIIITTLTIVTTAFVWMNSQVNMCIRMVYENNEKIYSSNEKMYQKINEIEKDIAIIKTVLIMKDMLPKEVAAKPDK